MRWIAMVAAAALLAGFAGFPVRAADDMLLHDQSEPNLRAYGWTFSGLALLTLGYGVYAYNKSQDELDKADKQYLLYRDATTEANALKYRKLTERHHDQAKIFEARANGALALTIIFGLTATYSFSPESAPDLSLSTTWQGPVLTWRF